MLGVLRPRDGTGQLSRATLTYLSGVLRRHRRAIGSCWRNLNVGQQALLVLLVLLVLAHLRKARRSPSCRRIQRGHLHRLAIRDRGRRPVGRPGPEAAAGTRSRLSTAP